MINMKVLVVDDAPHVLKAVQDTLEAYGCEVYEAVNGEEALIRYRDVAPDIVLMDILMPKVDGVRATRNIIKYDSDARIIVITALGKLGLEKDCLEAGASGFIMKPFKTKELLDMINSRGKNEGN